MSSNLEEFKIVEKIKILYLKYKGNLFSILKDLGWSEDEEHIKYIEKLIKKFKGKESKDVTTRISHTLMQYLFFGHESRTHHLMETLKTLEERDRTKVSLCCEAPVKRFGETIIYGYEDYECLHCHLLCQIKVTTNEKILDLKLGSIEQLREEDKTLVEFAIKMGYTNKQEFPPAPQIKQNVIILNEGEGKIRAIAVINRLSPLERDILIDKLTKKIVD